MKSYNAIYIRILAFGLFAVSSLAAKADDKVVVVNANGEKVFSASVVQRININDDGIEVVDYGENGTTFAFDDQLKIMLQSGQTAIDGLSADGAESMTLTVSSDGNRLSVRGWQAGKSADLTVYDTAGAVVVHNAGWNGQDIDASSLSSGVYIMKIDEHKVKFRK